MAAPSTVIQRCTMFKVKDEKDLPFLAKCYEKMRPENKKQGKPYIISLWAGPTHAPSDPRHNGYNFAAISRFASLEDMHYYDDGDPAHDELRNTLRPLVDGIQTIYFEDKLPSTG